MFLSILFYNVTCLNTRNQFNTQKYKNYFLPFISSLLNIVIFYSITVLFLLNKICFLVAKLKNQIPVSINLFNYKQSINEL